jgi:hypothetical protein
VAPPPIERAFRNFASSSVDGVLHYVGTDWRRLAEATRHGAAVYSEFIDTCVWCVPNPAKGAFYCSGHGLVLVFKNGTGAHVDNVNVDCSIDRRNRSNVWSYPAIKASPRGRDRQPGRPSNGKPVALADDIIKDASERGEVVLAAFPGADAVLLAAEETAARNACSGILGPRALRRLHHAMDAGVEVRAGALSEKGRSLPGTITASCGFPLMRPWKSEWSFILAAVFIATLALLMFLSGYFK